MIEEAVARRTASLWPHLDERQRRLVLGAEARELGWGGVELVAAAAAVSLDTPVISTDSCRPSASRCTGGQRGQREA